MNPGPLSTRWQSLPESAVRHLQAEKLRTFLRDVVLPFSAYYRELLEKHGLSSDSFRSLGDLSRIPFTTKSDLLNTVSDPERAKRFLIIPDEHVIGRQPKTVLHALFRGRSRVRREMESEYRPIFLTSTTGRSADPIPFLFTQHDLDRLALTGRRLFEVCGARPDMRLLNIFPYAPHLAFWQTHYGSEAFGAFMVSTGGGKVSGTEGQLRFLRKVRPNVLIGMPTFTYHVLHQAAEENVRCESLQRIVLGGEKVPDGLRRKLIDLAKRMGAENVDVVATYGFTEAKMAFAECPRRLSDPSCGYHLYPDLGIFEVIDPGSGEPVPPGHPGELVFTPLDSRGTVVLRFRTGDLIDGGLTYAPCPACGRCVPRLLGRISRSAEVREMQLDKFKGTLVDFNELEHVLDDCPDVGAWQIELRKRDDDPFELDELILHVAKRSRVFEAQLTRALNEHFIARAEIRPDRVLYHSEEEMRVRQGVGRELKEQRIIDQRPARLAARPAPPPGLDFYSPLENAA